DQSRARLRSRGGDRQAARHPGRRRGALRARRAAHRAPRRGERRCAMSVRLDRRGYAELYGPTTGDRVRLGDTDLIAEVERDHTSYGDECKFGGGKVLRDRMGQAAGVTEADAL